jgi:hypothetical protein
VLSFDALRGLARAVDIPVELAWLLPISVDAGASVSSAIWLGGRTHAKAARFAGGMTWSLLAVTVGGNAGQLGMHANHIDPPWWVAVLVGSIPPAVVGATVHLIVLLVRRPISPDSAAASPDSVLDGPDDEDFGEWTVADEIARIKAGGGTGDADADGRELRRLEYLQRRNLPDRAAAVDTDDTRAIIADLRAGAGRTVPPGQSAPRCSRDDICSIYRVGKGKADNAYKYLAWGRRDRADEQAESGEVPTP